MKNLYQFMGLRIIILTLLLLTLPEKLLAITSPSPTNPSLIPPGGELKDGCNFKTGIFNATCIPDYLRYLLELIFMFIGAFFLLMIIIAGYQIAIGSAIGDKEAGKNRLKSAIVGFIVSALSFFIVDYFIAVLSS